MYKNSSFIDILQGISTAQQNPDQDSQERYQKSHDKQESLIQTLPHYQSTQYLYIPNQHSKQKLSPILKGELNTEPVMLITKTKIREICNDQQKYDKNQDNKSAHIVDRSKFSLSKQARSDQTSFKIKLKLASFITKFNIDSQFLSNVREHSIDSILEIVFNKFKDYAREHEKLIKSSNEILKIKQIEILNLKSQLSTLEQMNCQEINRYHKARDKQKDDQLRLQTTIETLSNENEELKQTIYMLEQIVKQQNQYIKSSQLQTSADLQSELQSLQTKLQVSQNKCTTLAKQVQSLQVESANLHEQNTRLNDEINDTLHQVKLYKQQSMFAKQNAEKLQTDLETNEQKLINLFEKYQHLDQQLKINARERQQIQNNNQKLMNQHFKVLQEIESIIDKNRVLSDENKLLAQQIRGLKDENKDKEKQILRLSKSLSEIANSYKSRQLQRKNKSIDSQNSDSYRINIISEDSASLFQNKIEELKLGHEAQVKQIIEGWKDQLEKTVNYYQKILEDYEKQFNERQLIVDQKLQRT